LLKHVEFILANFRSQIEHVAIVTTIILLLTDGRFLPMEAFITLCHFANVNEERSFRNDEGSSMPIDAESEIHSRGP